METPMDANNGILDVRDASGRLCGRYHYEDPFISFFRGLYTPKGFDIVSPPPPDHPHHKGLQFGLCAQDVDFWEESTQSAGGRRVGRQVTEKLDPSASGFSQQIVWRDDVCVSFHETRTISVQPTGSGFVWSWQTTLTAERDVTLDVSAWPNGHGYVGLGLRLLPDLFLNKSTVTSVPKQQGASGGVPQSVTIRGTKAALTFEQDTQFQQNVLYILGCETNSEFAFVSLGPTNGHGFPVNKGDSLTGNYRITVADVG
jgi:hypothetical protein